MPTINDDNDLKIPLKVTDILKEFLSRNPLLVKHQDILTELSIKIFDVASEYSKENSIVNKLANLEEKVSALQINQSIPTYASILSSPASQRLSSEPSKLHGSSHTKAPAQILLLYPSDPHPPKEISSETTLKIGDLKKLFQQQANNIGFLRIHYIKKGGILIELRNNEDLLFIKRLISTKFSNKIIIKIPQARIPEIRIKNLDPEVIETNIIQRLIEQNNIPEHQKSNLVSAKITTTSFGRRDAILTIHNPLFSTLLERGKICLGFCSSFITENFSLRSCSICCNTNHNKASCPTPDKIVCNFCGDNHKSQNCKNKTADCWKCSTLSHTNNPQHKFGSQHCSFYLNEVKKLISFTNYDAAE